MSKLIVNGGRRLCGEMPIHGAKNSALPILSAAVLCESKCVLENCPRISDIDAAIHILKHLGCAVSRYKNTVEIDPSGIREHEIPAHLI